MESRPSDRNILVYTILPAKNSFHSPSALPFSNKSQLLEKKITDRNTEEVRELLEQKERVRKMGRYIKKCKGIAEIAVVELPEIDGGVRTREKELVTVGKRIREVGDGELDLASGYVELRSTRRRVLIEATASVSLVGASPSNAPVNSFEESNCAFDLSPLCLSKTSGDHVEYRGTNFAPEAQPKSSQVETMTFYGGGRGRSNTLVAEGSSGMESTAGRPWTETNSGGGPILVHEMPSECEIEDFFSAAEQDLQKRFSEKYNFDTIRGVPLEGRYEWVPVHHEWS